MVLLTYNTAHVYRDLKMENIMLDESLRNIKLIGKTSPFDFIPMIYFSNIRREVTNFVTRSDNVFSK